MNEKNDIRNLKDIRLLVDSFYADVREDKLLGPVFNKRIEDRWPQHLDRMYTFWQTVLLEERTYFGAPFPVHRGLPVDFQHFDRWLELFVKTVDRHFTGRIAEEAKWRAGKMAELFEYKLREQSIG